MIETPDYRRYKNKRNQWISCIRGKDPNCIGNSLARMLWQAAVFNIVVTARELNKNEKGFANLNGMFHSFIDECYSHKVCIDIRKMNDGYPLEGDNGVFSLASLIKDMINNNELVTRGNILQYEKINNLEEMKKRYFEWLDKHPNGGIVSEDCEYNQAEFRNKQLDRLCGIDAVEKRRPENKVCTVTVFT